MSDTTSEKQAGPSTVEVMIDCETLGTRPGCVIGEIGVVLWDRATGEELAAEEWKIDIWSCLVAGLTIDPKTVQFWSQAGGGPFAMVGEEGQPLEVVLKELAEWLEVAFREDGARVIWCRGGSADFPWLGAAYAAVGLPVPWKYWQERDARTWCEEAGVKREGKVAHRAVADCRAQIKEVMKADQLLSFRKVEPVVEREGEATRREGLMRHLMEAMTPGRRYSRGDLWEFVRESGRYSFSERTFWRLLQSFNGLQCRGLGELRKYYREGEAYWRRNFLVGETQGERGAESC